MTVAVRLSDGTTLVPVKLNPGDTIVESATVHAGSGFVVLDPGVDQFTSEGRERTEKTEIFRRYDRTVAVDELPTSVRTESEMDALRAQWENVDAFYRKVNDVSIRHHTPLRTYSVSKMRVIDIDSTTVPADASGWVADPEFIGIPAPLSALLSGRLVGVPELVAERLNADYGLRARASKPRHGDAEVEVSVEFNVAFADARTRLVKANPLNNRRNAKRIRIPDTKLVTLRHRVPAALAAPNLALAQDLLTGIIDAIRSEVDDPVAVCAACSGSGLVLGAGVYERRLP